MTEDRRLLRRMVHRDRHQDGALVFVMAGQITCHECRLSQPGPRGVTRLAIRLEMRDRCELLQGSGGKESAKPAYLRRPSCDVGGTFVGVERRLGAVLQVVRALIPGQPGAVAPMLAEVVHSDDREEYRTTERRTESAPFGTPLGQSVLLSVRGAPPIGQPARALAE